MPAGPVAANDGPRLTVRRSVLEGVLDLLARLFHITLGLVGLAFGLHFLVIEGIPGVLFGLTLEFFGLVVCLVAGAHEYLLTTGPSPAPYSSCRSGGHPQVVPARDPHHLTSK